MMKIDAALGRLFGPEDDIPGAAPVAVVRDGFWRRRFGADPTIVGQEIYTSGIPLIVVGVLPPNFTIMHPGSTFPKDIDVWTPMSGLLFNFFGTGDYAKLPRSSHFMNTIARMKPGVTLAQAQADMDAVALQMTEKTPDSYSFEGWGITVCPFTGILWRRRVLR